LIVVAALAAEVLPPQIVDEEEDNIGARFGLGILTTDYTDYTDYTDEEMKRWSFMVDFGLAAR